MNDETNLTADDTTDGLQDQIGSDTSAEDTSSDEANADEQSQDAPNDDQKEAGDDEPPVDEAEEEKRLAELDKETEDDKADKPLDADVWGSTGHTVADEALRTLQNVGLSTDDAKELLLEAALSRDPSMVDQKALVAKIGPRRAKAIMESLETFSSDMRPKDRRLSDEVFQHTNGPNAYRRLIEEAGDVLSDAEMQGYIRQISKGGSTALRAIESLQEITSGKPISLDRRVHTEQFGKPKAASQPKTMKGITSKTYVDAMQALDAPGNRMSFEARDKRIADLREARRIGREAGLP